MSDLLTSGGDARLQAFERIVADRESALLRYVMRLINDRDAAQDVVQETFLRLHRNWQPEMDTPEAASNWLYRVAHNCAVDHVRKEVRRSRLHERHSAEQADWAPPDRGQGFRISEAAERAAAALQALNLRERQLVILKVYEQKSYREISAITDLTETNIGYILHHAMKKLARALREAGVEPGAGGAADAADRPAPSGGSAEEAPE